MPGKLLLHLTSEQLCAWHWQRGTLTAGPCCAATRSGVEQLADWLSGYPGLRAFLLADLVEEDFQLQRLPHVPGRGGMRLRARRLLQAFRDTPYRSALVQGRAAEGRRDDIVLLAALTNPALLTPWLDLLDECRVPLAGIYSPGLLSAELLPPALRAAPHLLLVTSHGGGIRQTYFQYGQPRFSRLAQGGASADAEAARTRRFLVGAHWLGRDEALQVLSLLPLARMAERPAASMDSLLDWHVMPLEEAAARQRLPVTDLADVLFLGTLARHSPHSHYPLGRYQRHYHLWRSRVTLYASSGVLAACALVWSGANLAGFLYAGSRAAELRSEAARYEAAYRLSMSSMPPALDRTANMKAAVQIAHMVAQQGPWPQRFMELLSEALERSPQIRLLQLEWRAVLPGATPVSAASAMPGAAATPALLAPPSSMAIGIPKSPPQQLRLQAEVLAQQDDYRNVLASMNRFAKELAGNRHVTVEIEQLPFDIRPNVKLSGKVGAAAGGAGERPRFTMNLRWSP